MKSKSSTVVEKDASIYLRNQLKANYVTLPQVSHRIPIERYFTLAERLYQQAVQYYQKKDSQYINAYIDYQKFLLLILDRIPKHPQYKQINTTSNGSGKPNELALIRSKLWLEKVRLEALRSLEEIVQVMDTVEYHRQQSLKVDVLEAEFDEVDISSAGKTVQQSTTITTLTGQLTQTPPSPASELSSTRPASVKEIPNTLSTFQTVTTTVGTTFSDPVIPEGGFESPKEEILQTFIDNFPTVALNDSKSISTLNPVPIEASDPPPLAPLPLVDESLSSSKSVEDNQVKKWDILKNPYDLASVGTSTTSIALPVSKAVNQSPVVPPLPPPLPPVVVKPEPCPLPLEDIFIAKYLLAQSMQPLSVPQPVTTILSLAFSPQEVISFYRDDFHVSFSGFLVNLPIELQMSKAALEGNRCFFIHLGIGIGIHPFLLQTIFRYSTYQILRKQKDVWFEDLLQTVINYCDLVDANALSFLWPKELDQYYFCFLSGNLHQPVISTLRKNRPNNTPNHKRLKEVIIHCDGNHFTLLRPRNMSPFSDEVDVISDLVSYGKRYGCTVQENLSQEIPGMSEEERSIEGILQRIQSFA